MDTVTQALIDKIKRNSSITEGDDIIALRIQDSFDAIAADTQLVFLYFEDIIDYAILPDISTTQFSDVREAIVYYVLMGGMSKKMGDAADKSVIVRSGRDMVDTTSTARNLNTVNTVYERRYKERCQNIIEKNLSVGVMDSLRYNGQLIWSDAATADTALYGAR